MGEEHMEKMLSLSDRLQDDQNWWMSVENKSFQLTEN
jgi:hypothetical protein